MAIEGEFKVLTQDRWTPLTCGEPRYLRRGELHAFRNCGAKTGQFLAIAPGGLDQYLESTSPIRMPEDAARLFQISAEFGITFPQMQRSEAGEQVTLAVA